MSRPVVAAPPPSLASYVDSASDADLGGGGVGGSNRSVTTFAGRAENDATSSDHNEHADFGFGDPSLLSATDLTHSSACRCPHLDAVLPHILRLDRYDPIVELHLGKHFGDVAPLTAGSSAKLAAARAAAAAAGTASASHGKSSGGRHHHRSHHHQHHHHHNSHRPNNSMQDGGGSSPSKSSSRGKSDVPSQPSLNISPAKKASSSSSPVRSIAYSPSKGASNNASATLAAAGGGTGTTAVSKTQQRIDRAPFGPEHARLLAISGRGGASEHWCPVIPPLYQPSGSAGSRYAGAANSGEKGGDGGGGNDNNKEKKRKGSKNKKRKQQQQQQQQQQQEKEKEQQPQQHMGAQAQVQAPAAGTGTGTGTGAEGGTGTNTTTSSGNKNNNSTEAVSKGAAATNMSTLTGATASSTAAAACAAASAAIGGAGASNIDAKSSVGGIGATAAIAKDVDQPATKDEAASEKKAEEKREKAGARTKADVSTHEAENVTSSVPIVPPTASTTEEGASTSVDKVQGTTDAAASAAATTTDAAPSATTAATDDTVKGDTRKVHATDATAPKETSEVTMSDKAAGESKDEGKPSCDADAAAANAPDAKKKEVKVEEASGISPMEIEEPKVEDDEADKNKGDVNMTAAGTTGTSAPEPVDAVKNLPESSDPTVGKEKGATEVGPTGPDGVPSSQSAGVIFKVEGPESGAEATRIGNKPDDKADAKADPASKDGEDKAAEGGALAVPKDGTNPGDTAAKALVSDAPYNLTDSRYMQLWNRERRIIRERDNLMVKKRELPPPEEIRSPSAAQQKQTHRPTKRKKGETAVDGANAFTTSAAIHVVSDDELSLERRMLRSRASVMSSKVEEWLEVIRDGRRAYLDEQNTKHSRRRCAWCPQPPNMTASGAYRAPSGDELMQCLECSVIGCGPSSTYPDSSMHLMRHFIASGHNFGITCGLRAEVFCMKCGDFVYHEVFDQEKERIDISRYVPQCGWEAGVLRRSYEPLSFVSTPDHGVVWRGMMASYPTAVPMELVVAGRLSLKRLFIFRGDTEAGGGSATWGPLTLRLAISQSRLGKKCFKIKAPIGMYNLGNTCFMSSVLQCLINCAPIQRYFLRDVRHNHKACKVLRSAHGAAPSSPKKSKSNCGAQHCAGICIACEMDRLLLEYYGSTIGQNVVAALEEAPSPSSCFAASTDCATPKRCGEPLVPSQLLAATWKSGGMKHIAGYQQRDAHEFLSAFLDIMGKHDRHTQSIAMDMKAEARTFGSTSQDERQSEGSAGFENIVDHLFAGNLRSVLICEKCGYKRSLPEPFVNVSLPITKDTKTIDSCLQHFTHPEELSDSVVCPSCATKTPTRKQHTFAKLPKILCLHLKRFDAATNKKISDFVAYPASGLNLGPFLPHWCEVVQGTQGMKGPDAMPNETDAPSPQIMYDLYGTVNHTGSLHQGHYVANVKVDGKWYHCNDSFVCDAGEGDGEKAVLEADGAYMLFYMRRDVAVSAAKEGGMPKI